MPLLAPEQRKRLFDFVTSAAMIALAVLAARYGIPIPPPQLPPITVTPPPVQPVLPELPPAGLQPQPIPNPPAAIVRLSFPGVGCSGTIIGPRRPDGRWWVLTAAHCSKTEGQHGTIRLLDGRTTGVVVASIDRKADCCWMYTETNDATYPFALLAESTPPVGTPIWHAGYGVDRPGNREDGEITGQPNQDGQLRMRLSVSSGDSGGGILTNSKGEVVSCVCCTSARGQRADVWGCSPEAARRARPTSMVLDDWTPSEVPLRRP